LGFLFCFFLLARIWFLLYTSCMLRGALRFFNIFICLPIKKIITVRLILGSLDLSARCF